MKTLRIISIVSIYIFLDPQANASPHTQQIELTSSPASPASNNYSYSAKLCVGSCWLIAWIPTTLISCAQDLSCGACCCGKSPCSSEHYDDDETICTNSCPQYCIPNIRHNIKTLLDTKPRIMQ